MLFFNVEVKEVGFDNEISILCGVRIDYVSNNFNKCFFIYNFVIWEYINKLIFLVLFKSEIVLGSDEVGWYLYKNLWWKGVEGFLLKLKGRWFLMKNNNNGRFDVRKGMKLVGSSEYSSIE